MEAAWHDPLPVDVVTIDVGIRDGEDVWAVAGEFILYLIWQVYKLMTRSMVLKFKCIASPQARIRT